MFIHFSPDDYVSVTYRNNLVTDMYFVTFARAMGAGNIARSEQVRLDEPDVSAAGAREPPPAERVCTGSAPWWGRRCASRPHKKFRISPRGWNRFRDSYR